jgi:hypothetical protein
MRGTLVAILVIAIPIVSIAFVFFFSWIIVNGLRDEEKRQALTKQYPVIRKYEKYRLAFLGFGFVAAVPFMITSLSSNQEGLRTHRLIGSLLQMIAAIGIILLEKAKKRVIESFSGTLPDSGDQSQC